MKDKQKGKLICKILAGILGMILLLCLSVYFTLHSYYIKMNTVNSKRETEWISVSQNEEKQEQTEDALETETMELFGDERVFNILLIGYDEREGVGGKRSDSMILLSINRDSKELIATSIMRDIYVEIPGHGSNRINAAYAYGGEELLVKTIEQNFRIKINRYVSVDFFVFIDIVDKLGGVEIEVKDEEVETMNGYINDLNFLLVNFKDTDCLSEGGMYLLNGKQALAYSRIRYVGDADFERTKRQRRVLEQIFYKIKECNLTEMNELLEVLLPEVTTDLTEGEVISLMLNMNTYKKYALVEHRIPYDGTYSFRRIEGMAVLGIDLEENIRMMKRDIYKQDEYIPAAVFGIKYPRKNG
ncbi:MAG: LCP family protein [Lachnospiraceae bacterium]|nr:LCP family protein [Lachnospiraceae bacterium]